MDSPQYVAARIQRALAEDERSNELGIRVDVRGEHVFLRGQVSGEEHLRLIKEVACEVAPDMIVHNEVTLVEVLDPGMEEHL
jgi:osmotically-inducible protein OsmY